MNPPVDSPLLEARDTHAPAGLGARTGERPAVLHDLVVPEDEVVHEHLDVGKGGDERLRNLADPGWLAAVDGDRPARNVVCGDASRVAAAPRLGVAAGELLDLSAIVRHSCRDPNAMSAR